MTGQPVEGHKYLQVFCEVKQSQWLELPSSGSSSGPAEEVWFLLLLPDRYFSLKLNEVSWAAQRCSAAPSFAEDK